MEEGLTVCCTVALLVSKVFFIFFRMVISMFLIFIKKFKYLINIFVRD